MNILPKKRWHVRTKDNIARVRKDEAAAQEEERKREEKLKLAESEARVNFLRKCSGVPQKLQYAEIAEEKQLSEDACSSEHINLFADYKSHIKTTNKDSEKEKKEEQEKYEKKIGYLTYLGQDTNEALRLKSWYEIAPERLEVGSEKGKIKEKDLKTKHNHDPLTLINALLPTDSKVITTSNTIKRKRSGSPKVSIKSDHSEISKQNNQRKNHKKRKQKKRSKEHKSKKEKPKEKYVDEQIRKRLKIEQLRKERLRRETTERARQEALLMPTESKKTTDVTNISAPKIVQKYNSQFNPELAKQNLN